MILYHGTTEMRAKQIFDERMICCHSERFFTEESNGNGYSTDGYVYLTNEITFAAFFANSHSLVDKSSKLYIFRMSIPKSELEPDYDEMRYQDPTGFDRERYETDMDCSLLEFKACRVPFDIRFEKYALEYCVIDKNLMSDIPRLLDNAGADYKYVIDHYTTYQKNFINSITWKPV